MAFVDTSETGENTQNTHLLLTFHRFPIETSARDESGSNQAHFMLSLFRYYDLMDHSPARIKRPSPGHPPAL
jgi:hypothetical protein